MREIITYLWLALIPGQLGKHFWLTESRVWGIKIDYLSIILYLTDLLWVVWVFLETRKQKQETRHKEWWKVSVALVVVVGNIAIAQAKWVAAYRWLRMGQWLLTFYLVSKNKKDIGEKLLKVIPFWIIVESFLALAQVVKGGSLDGLWWWLGERRFLLGNLGIAEIRVVNKAWVRAYGTFSHPNSLAGFLLLAWVYFKKRKEKGEKENEKLKTKVWKWIVNWSAVLGIILAGSRTVWILSILVLILGRGNKKGELKKNIFGKMLVAMMIVVMLLGIVKNEYELKGFLGGWDKDGWTKRVSLAVSAKKMFMDSPLFGVGKGNFVAVLPKYQGNDIFWLQPVHNIFLLVFSEIGIFGVILLYKLLGKIRKKDWQILGIIILSGIVDHYWVTLAQNSWLIAIILGLMR